MSYCRFSRNNLIVLLAFCFSIFTVNTHQLSLPNIGMLQAAGILDNQANLIQQSVLSVEPQVFEQNRNLTVDRSQNFNFKLNFEMFLYPYRIYSYFDQIYQKQYLLVRISITEYRVFNLKGQTIENPHTFQTDSSEDSSILDARINPYECLNSPNPEATDCLSQTQLFDLFPQYLTFLQEEHQYITLYQVDSQRLILKNHAKPSAVHNINYFQVLKLLRLDLHGFIFQARSIFLKCLLACAYGDTISANSQAQSESPLSQPSFPQISAQNVISKTNVSVKQFFSNKIKLETTMFEHSHSLYHNILSEEGSFNIDDHTVYSYAATAEKFHLISVRSDPCPSESPSVYGQNTFSQENDQYCTFLKIQTTNFASWKDEPNIEYISTDEDLKNITTVSTQTVDKQTLKISLSNSENHFEIALNKKSKNVNSIQLDQKSMLKGHFYLQQKKVFIYREKALIIGDDQAEECEFDLHPWVLTFRKIHDSLFVACVQGSTCYFVNDLCERMGITGFSNTFGMEWSFKVNPIIADGIVLYQSYVQAFKPGDHVRQIYSLPFDKELFKKPSLNLDKFYPHNYKVVEVEPLLYEIWEQTIDFNQEHDLDLTSQREVKYRVSSYYQEYRPQIPKLFTTSIYGQLSMFKKQNLQWLIRHPLSRLIQQFYTPKMLKHQGKPKSNPPSQSMPPSDSTDSNGQLKLSNLLSDCQFNQSENLLNFDEDWSMCELYITCDTRLAFLEVEKGKQDHEVPSVAPISLEDLEQQESFSNTLPTQSTFESSSKGTEDRSKVELELENEFLRPQLPTEPPSLRQQYNLRMHPNFSRWNNSMLVCAIHQNSSPTSKCRLASYEITDQFHQNSQNLRVYLEPARHYQIYFFRRSFLSENQQSFLEQLKEKALQTINKQSPSPTNKELVGQQEDSLTENQGTEEQLNAITTVYQQNHKQFQILFRAKQWQETESKSYDLLLKDFQKEELQQLSKILVIGYCVFIPLITICCFLVCFKSYIQNLLIYYGVIRTEPSFRYPLNPLALKIKMKELQKKGYAKVIKKRIFSPSFFEFESETGTGSTPQDTQPGVDCCFCIQSIDPNQEIVELYCQHQFHSDCFTEWVRNEPNTKCPFCRREFSQTALSRYQESQNQPPKNGEVQSHEPEEHSLGQVEQLEFES